MSLDDTLERPAASAASASNASRWSVVDVDPALAAQANWPIVANAGGVIFVYGGDGGTAVQRSTDNGASWTALTADYAPRPYAAGLASGGRLWLVGGQTKCDTLISTNGSHWVPRAGQGGWGPRTAHSVVDLGGRLYLLAGVNQTGRPMGDVWQLSATGDQWTVVKDNAFSPRLYCASATFNGQIVLMGGNGDSGALSEVLSSADGANWQTRVAHWAGRWGAAAAVVGDTLYLVGGRGGGDQDYDEVWATRDLDTWLQVETPPAALAQMAATGAGGQLLVLGGTGPAAKVLAYSPADGWTEIAESGEAGLLSYPSVARLGNVTYALDGAPQTPVEQSMFERVWTPVGGANLPYRRQPAACAHQGKLWVTGGELRPGTSCSDVFFSADGYDWTQLPEANWGPRKQHVMLSFENQLWVIGGLTQTEGPASDVYVYDGEGWPQERANPFPGRYAAAGVVFKEQIWILGGRGAGGPIAGAVRRETNGEWTSFPAPWAPRYGLAAGVMGGRLYVSLGQGTNGPLTDTWVSDDGQTWTQVAGPAGPALRDNAGWLVHDDALLVLGGTAADGSPNNAVRRYLPPV